MEAVEVEPIRVAARNHSPSTAQNRSSNQTAGRPFGRWCGLSLFWCWLWSCADRLGDTPPVGDEAESAMNATTILDHGVPTGTYLGLPIYENTLTEPWPGNTEYEFRDSSYSSKGVTIYHGWLPLYSMAASFKFFGVQPDQPTATLHVQHTAEEMQRRTMAARASHPFSSAFCLSFSLSSPPKKCADSMPPGQRCLSRQSAIRSSSLRVSALPLGHRSHQHRLLLDSLANQPQPILGKFHRRRRPAGGDVSYAFDQLRDRLCSRLSAAADGRSRSLGVDQALCRGRNCRRRNRAVDFAHRILRPNNTHSSGTHFPFVSRRSFHLPTEEDAPGNSRHRRTDRSAVGGTVSIPLPTSNGRADPQPPPPDLFPPRPGC